MSNPLLHEVLLPPFSQIKPADIKPAIESLLEQNRETVARLTAHPESADWDSVIAPLDEMGDRLNNAWSPVSHMNSVVNSDELREAYNACLPLLSEYWTEMGQHEGMFKAYQQVATQADQLNPVQQKVIENNLRDFQLSGIALDPRVGKTHYRQRAACWYAGYGISCG
jgi:oligopeptidase A